MNEEFIVKRIVEGNTKTTPDVETICNTMAGQAFNERYLGSVAAVVEVVGGIVTKQRLNWNAANDPNFNRTQQKNADALLAATIKAAQGGGDPSEIKVKIVVKM